MLQSNSSMFSDAVYLFGTTFSSPSSGGSSKEELPDGTKVDRKKLAERAVLAAFACLYHQKLIDFILGEEKSLRTMFIKRKRAIVKKLQSSPPYDTSGLEAAIFAHVQDNVGIYDITRELLPGQIGFSGFSWQVGHKPLRDVSDPWGDILQIVKMNLLRRGILKEVEKSYITTKYVMNGDISKEEEQVTELKKTLKELQSKGELYQQILSDIGSGIASRLPHVQG
jgi:hypothetical protein